MGGRVLVDKFLTFLPPPGLPVSRVSLYMTCWKFCTTELLLMLDPVGGQLGMHLIHVAPSYLSLPHICFSITVFPNNIWTCKYQLQALISGHPILWQMCKRKLVKYGKRGLPKWYSSKESHSYCRKREFNPWVGKTPWRRKWQPTPVSLPENSHGQRSLADDSPWGHEESDMTERLSAAGDYRKTNVSKKWTTVSLNLLFTLFSPS